MEKFVNNSEENGMEEEPSFSDPEDFIDNVSDQDLLADLLRDKPKEADGIDSVIVVDNVPVVGQERLEKLQNVLRKVFSKFGHIVSESYPKDTNGKTKGYIFLEYKSPENAKEAVKHLDNYKLDKLHMFSVNLFTDFDKYSNISEDWKVPEKKPYKDLGNLQYWLQDADCNDQFSVIYEGGDRTAIYWNTYQDQVLIEERPRWTETYARWSPSGTYLATFHQRGIALWGGEKFDQKMRFAHSGVQLIDFSPCERYLVTFSPVVDSKDEPQAIIIWDIRTGVRKRSFHCENAAHWPVFKWNRDGKYFARISQDNLSIFETPSFGLLDKKSIKVSNIKDFSWCPASNVLAYWVPEVQDSPARVVLLEAPTRKELRAKNLFHVGDCKMHWHNAGDFLCVKVDRLTKSKKQAQLCNFEIFRMKEKQIPVDSVEIKESITAFAWEPCGSKFAFLHGDSSRSSVSFYQITKGKVEFQKCMENKSASNGIFWSPIGQFVVLAGIRSLPGTLEFIDTSDYTLMNAGEHFMATDVDWDPTGRFVATGVSWWGHKVDNAYWIWNFQGKLLHKHSIDRFCQLLWRPRPPTLLSEDQLKNIKKNIKTYSKQFEMRDRMTQSKASKELIEKRRQMMDDFKRFCKRSNRDFENNKSIRLSLRGGVDTDDLNSNVDEWGEEVIEFFIKEEITILEEE